MLWFKWMCGASCLSFLIYLIAKSTSTLHEISSENAQLIINLFANKFKSTMSCSLVVQCWGVANTSDLKSEQNIKVSFLPKKKNWKTVFDAR